MTDAVSFRAISIRFTFLKESYRYHSLQQTHAISWTVRIDYFMDVAKKPACIKFTISNAYQSPKLVRKTSENL